MQQTEDFLLITADTLGVAGSFSRSTIFSVFTSKAKSIKKGEYYLNTSAELLLSCLSKANNAGLDISEELSRLMAAIAQAKHLSTELKNQKTTFNPTQVLAHASQQEQFVSFCSRIKRAAKTTSDSINDRILSVYHESHETKLAGNVPPNEKVSGFAVPLTASEDDGLSITSMATTYLTAQTQQWAEESEASTADKAQSYAGTYESVKSLKDIASTSSANVSGPSKITASSTGHGCNLGSTSTPSNNSLSCSKLVEKQKIESIHAAMVSPSARYDGGSTPLRTTQSRFIQTEQVSIRSRTSSGHSQGDDAVAAVLSQLLTRSEAQSTTTQSSLNIYYRTVISQGSSGASAVVNGTRRPIRVEGQPIQK